MKVLVVGNGGREHAIVRQFSRSKLVTSLYCIPGNAGTEAIATNLSHIGQEDVAAIAEEAERLKVDLVFVGPEGPLSLGAVDALEARGIRVIGPNKHAAQLESSKAFTKDFLLRNNIPTAAAHIFRNSKDFDAFADNIRGPWVVKKSGLAAGKGVLESDDPSELKTFAAPFFEDGEVLVEEYLRGFEVSIFGLSDGKDWRILPPTSDYKKAGDQNTGPNTGGMGAICPVPWLDEATMTRIETELVEPVYKALKKDGIIYKGVLYFGVMVTKDGPKVLEFNVRFGDPEAQVVLPRITSDFYELCEAMATGTLTRHNIEIDSRSAIGVVIAAEGYPAAYKKQIPVSLEESVDDDTSFIFQASTYRENGVVRTNGGRCFTLVGLAHTIDQAKQSAYSLRRKVSFEGAWCRSDIGTKVHKQKY